MHPLLQQVRTVAHQARRLVVREAFARWLCVVMLAVAGMAFADYLFRFRENPLRWLGLLAVGSVAWWYWRKSVGPVLADRWTDRQIAQWIERSVPELRDRLSSAVAFLHFPAKDPRYGSDALRADVVQRTAAVVAKQDLSEVLDASRERRALRGLMVVMVLLGALVASDHDAAILALRRLGMPWSHEMWPRQHHLTFTQRPTALAQGQDFQVELVNEHGKLPPEVTMLYWFEGDDEEGVRRHRMTFSGGKLTHRLPGVQRSFRYRAVGGDDQEMDWTSLRVVVPPRIVESRVTVHFPGYTGRAAERSERRIRALAGSTAEVRIRVDKPVRTAVLVFHPANGLQRIAARVHGEGRSCYVPEQDGTPWILSVSGTYGWELTDQDGMTVVVDDSTEVDVAADLPPVVSIESPPTDAAFTTRGVVPVRCSVKDDLAIQKVEFRAGSTAQVISKFPPANSEEPRPTDKGITQRTIEHAWDLAKIPDLKPGTSLPFEVVAEDFLPQSSLPANGVIRILSDSEFQQRLDEGQASLLQRIHEALQLQRTLHSRTSSLVTQLRATKQLVADDASVWPVLDPGQRRVATLLSGEDGASRRVERLLAELANNRWEAPQLVIQLTAMQGELARIVDQLLPPIQQHLLIADRQLRFELSDVPIVVEAWTEAAGGQEQVITALESLVDQLGQWSRYRNLAQEVRQILEEHSAILEETRAMPTTGRNLSQLTAEERTQLERLARRLSDIAAQVDRMQLRLDQIQQRLAKLNPAAAESLQEALKVLEREPVSGGIREAGRSVADNRLGAATKGLEQAREGLQNLLAALEQRPAQDSRQLEELLVTAVSLFVQRQEQLLLETTELGKRTDRDAREPSTSTVAKGQTDLAADVRELAERMPESSSYALALELAAQLMTGAGERLAQAQFDEQTLKLEREALVFLKDLLASLASQPPAPAKPPEKQPTNSDPEEPASSHAPSLAELKLIRLVHLEILRRTGDLEKLRQTAGSLSDEQERELEALADRQRRLAELLERIEPPPRDEPSKAKPGTLEPSALRDHVPRRPTAESFVWVNWLQVESGTRPAAPPPKQPVPGSALDRSLLDDLPPASGREPGRTPSRAGEDVGQPGDATPLAELSRQMRQIESLLQARDTTARTQQLQRRVAVELTSLIDELEKQQTGAEQESSQRREPPPSDSRQTPGGAKPAGQPGSGSGSAATDTDAVTNWARGVWGVLPDRVQQQIQSLGDEQFLPEYEEIIRQYYSRLSERGRK